MQPEPTYIGVVRPQYEPVDHDPFAQASGVFPEFDAAAPSASEFTVDPVTGNPILSKPAQLPLAIKRLLGVGGERRHVLWPEQMVHDIAETFSGERPAESTLGVPGTVPPGTYDVQYEPNKLGKFLGMEKPWVGPSAASDIAGVQAATGLAGGAPLMERAGAATLGSGAVRSMPDRYLVPAVKMDGKVYKGQRGQEHLDVLEQHGLIPQEVTGTGNLDDVIHYLDSHPNYRDGFVNHKGQFLSRESAGKYAVDNDLLADKSPENADWVRRGGFTADMLASDTGKPSVGLTALKEANRAPPFYSAVENAVRGARQDSMTPEQWRGYLRNQPGVKDEELAWSGLPEGKKLTRQQVLDHLNEHGVQVKEVEKSSLSETPDESWVEDTTNDHAQTALSEWRDRHNGAEPSEQMAHRIWGEVNDDVRANPYDYGWDGAGDTKFGAPNLVLPGGENYRERLFTLPHTGRTTGRWEYVTSDGQRRAAINEADAIKMAEKTGGYVQSQPELFTGSHWDEPNVLAHVRMNDRDIPGAGDPGFAWRNKKSGNYGPTFRTEAKAHQYLNMIPEHMRSQLELTNKQPGDLKSLHLEELQSDWHQQGRKKGYGPVDISKWSVRNNSDGSRSVLDQTGREYGPSTNHPAMTDRQLIESYHRAYAPQGVGVPDAPFKTTWPDLILKRSIREAAENGYDAISWTPGEAQAARYDLSKQIKNLHYTKTDKGYLLGPETHTGHEVPVNNGQPIPAEKLADYIGKDVADKIIKGEGTGKDDGIKTLSGLDLKVGGEGMRAFYDKMLVDKANALAKKFGGKVEWKPLDQFDVGRTGGVGAKQWQVIDKADKHQGFFATKAEAEAWIKEHDKVPVLRLTPQLRDAALRRGFPLFAAGVPFPLEPVDHDPFATQENKR